ncbi:MAG: RNA-binding protein [Thermoprotei archaeon]|nr:YhbY family RNA-binding protein [Thermoproteales archaeon]RLE85303.1 MAG: RNA-binding protein [Thermoprotei archaeon]RLE96183.1 MAG: RNA-binding protein [Thermoprotei archaeon]
MELVVVRVGKKGVTEGLLRELDNVLRARGMVKVKLLRNFREAYGIDSRTKRKFAEDLARRLGAKLVEVRGYTLVLRRGGGRG